jgi:citrate synthase
MKIQERIADQLPAWRDRVARLKKEYGSLIVGDVTLEQIYGGIRDVQIQVSDISYVDPQEGIRLRGYSIPEVVELLPRMPGTQYPMAGGLYYLLMADTLPTEQEALEVEENWRQRSQLPGYLYDVMRAMPESTHPMTMFSTAILTLQQESVFAQRYSEGLGKADYWIPYLEDSDNLIAKLPGIAALIYNMKYQNGQVVEPNDELDWGATFAHLIGKGEDTLYMDLCRLFLVIHSDHEGGNVSAHTSHLVCSALSDIYYTCSAGMNGLAGPLHGLANQECLKWILDVKEHFGGVPSREELRKFLAEQVGAGKVIPGYGHAVLRTTDPRFTVQFNFANHYLPDDDNFRLVRMVYEILPAILGQVGKVKSPWPNVDAINGALQYHYGITQFNFYTVMFGVSRILGLCAHAVWARALQKPIERPKSLTTSMLEDMIAHSTPQGIYRVPMNYNPH